MSSPRGAGELADFVEHLSVWAGAGIDAEAFLGRFDLSAGERRRVRRSPRRAQPWGDPPGAPAPSRLQSTMV